MIVTYSNATNLWLLENLRDFCEQFLALRLSFQLARDFLFRFLQFELVHHITQILIEVMKVSQSNLFQGYRWLDFYPS